MQPSPPTPTINLSKGKVLYVGTRSALLDIPKVCVDWSIPFSGRPVYGILSNRVPLKTAMADVHNSTNGMTLVAPEKNKAIATRKPSEPLGRGFMMNSESKLDGVDTLYLDSGGKESEILEGLHPQLAKKIQTVVICFRNYVNNKDETAKAFSWCFERGLTMADTIATEDSTAFVMSRHPMLTTPINRDFFPDWLNAQKLLGVGVEIGVYYGLFANHILNNWNGEKLYGIDPYIPFEEYVDGCKEELEEAKEFAIDILAMKEGRHEMLLKTSDECVSLFKDGSLDFVYVDGNHSEEQCTKDIKNYWPKIKSGGILGCHDYYNRNDQYQNCGVQTAVDAFCKSNGLAKTVTDCTTAWIRKP